MELLLAAALFASANTAVPPPRATASAIPSPAALARRVNVDYSPAILGTRPMPIAASRFNASMARARQDASASPALQRLIGPARRLPPLQQLAYVQRAVHTLIQWRSDATEWGQHDYWASAAQTLSHGAGDMEDRAIVKYQALRALGFSNSDLFLTMARDRVAGPITVVTVRHANQFYILDDTGGSPYRAFDRRLDFQPLISFSQNGAWVHARPMTVAATATAAAASTGR